MTGKSQESGFAVSVTADYGFESKPIILNEYEINEIRAIGASGIAQYSHSIAFPGLSLNAGIGVRYFQLTANTESSELEGIVVQPSLHFGVNYQALKKHHLNLGLIGVPNEDLDDFENEMSDLIRYNYSISYQYDMNKRISFLIGYSGIVYPNKDLYRVENPGHTISSGVQFNFWK